MDIQVENTNILQKTINGRSFTTRFAKFSASITISFKDVEVKLLDLSRGKKFTNASLFVCCFFFIHHNIHIYKLY